ncbi:MAG: TylF/MycF/NovP-related O-methyltransferase [Candidatus Saccharibacteria bacterium]|nr:TylF/MycF/NovP-related O-methyltransferase [Candidatus Saccharibacteria bacterium]
MKQVADVETSEILKIARGALSVPGDFVELGCYEGDTSLLLAEVLKGADKKLWLYDSFEGLPAKTLEDESAAGENFQEGVLAVTKREVKLRFLRANLPVPIIKKAWFSDLTADDLPEKIAFAFLDGDLYQSIKESLALVWDKMADGGVIIVHDYDNPELPGVTKAVDEWLSTRGNIKTTKKQTLLIINL